MEEAVTRVGGVGRNMSGGYRRLFFAAVVVVCAVGVWGGGKSADARDEPFTRVRPYNLSSHLPEFFKGLLKNRVWVYERNGSPAGMFFRPDGGVEGCWLRRDGAGFVRSLRGMGWRVGTPSGISNIDIFWPTAEGFRHYRMVLIFDGKSGSLHGERFSTEKLSWYVARRGWLQEEWPALFVEKCGKLGVDPGLPINEKQNGLDFGEFGKHAKPVVEPQGWELSFPGATGLGASGGKPTLSLEETLKHRRAGHGKIAIGMSGDRWVGVAWERYAELWKVDENDDIVDLAITRRTPEGSIVLLRWEKSGVINSYHIGYPIPMVVTDRKHSAFAMMEQLALEKKSVALADGSGTLHEHVFAEDGSVRIGETVGEWFISRGAVFVKTASGEQRYPWRDVANAAGWKRDAN